MTDKSDEFNQNIDTERKEPVRKERLGRTIRKVALVLLALVLLLVLYAGYIYASSPAVIREPKLEHYHFRMQVLVNGKYENFGDIKYQQEYEKDQCNANLPEQPIHFHDNKDQFMHIHWENMTGGMVMKYYGWNYIGGLDNALGYKLDNLKDIQKVTTHGNVLPAVPADAKFYIYTGDENGYQERSFEDWKNKDLEEFFGKVSNFPAHELNKQQSNLLNKLFPKAYAHGTEDHPEPASNNETDEQRLTRINNLIGNVVIFVQKDKPTNQQIKERFNDLEPLSDSTCGG